MRHLKLALGAAALSLGMTQAALAQTQGVSDTEVVIGSVTDLSGIFAAVGVPATNGATLRFEQQNAAGGVHGRQIRFIAEDMGYQLPRATQAYNKLVNRDRVFAMLLSLGTPHNLAGFQIMDTRGIINVNPMTAAREMLPETDFDNRFVGFSTYYDQFAAGMEFIREKYGVSKVCAMYLPTDYGKELELAAKEKAEGLGMTFVSETTHRPDEQDFVGAVQKLRADGCELVGVSLGPRQLITVVGTAKQLGWTDAKFLTTSAGFMEAIAAVPGGVTDGLYAAAAWVDLQARRDEEAPAKFIAEYEARFGQPATGFAMLGYNAAETLIRGLENAGRDLTTDTFREGMRRVDYHDPLTDSHISYSADNHMGANQITISVVENGRWKLISRQ